MDRSSLPHIPARTHITSGTTVIVTGENFDLFPGEVVLCRSENAALSLSIPNSSVGFFRVLSSTMGEFRFSVGHQYNSEVVFDIFATPSGPPRSILHVDYR